MAEQRLDDADIDTVLEQVGGEAVAQGVRADALVDIGGLSRFDDDTVELARAALGGQGGVVLLSPGAPSFGAYKDYVARGRHFAELAGFDPDSISAIPGIGIL